VAARPGTVLSKTTGNTIFQLVAQETPHEELQIVSYNPGLLYNQYMKSLGLPKEQFDSRECVQTTLKEELLTPHR
jgi:hypothetical protein